MYYVPAVTDLQGKIINAIEYFWDVKITREILDSHDAWDFIGIFDRCLKLSPDKNEVYMFDLLVKDTRDNYYNDYHNLCHNILKGTFDCYYFEDKETNEDYAFKKACDYIKNNINDKSKENDIINIINAINTINNL